MSRCRCQCQRNRRRGQPPRGEWATQQAPGAYPCGKAGPSELGSGPGLHLGLTTLHTRLAKERERSGQNPGRGRGSSLPAGCGCITHAPQPCIPGPPGGRWREALQARPFRAPTASLSAGPCSSTPASVSRPASHCPDTLGGRLGARDAPHSVFWKDKRPVEVQGPHLAHFTRASRSKNDPASCTESRDTWSGKWERLLEADSPGGSGTSAGPGGPGGRAPSRGGVPGGGRAPGRGNGGGRWMRMYEWKVSPRSPAEPRAPVAAGDRPLACGRRWQPPGACAPAGLRLPAGGPGARAPVPAPAAPRPRWYAPLRGPRAAGRRPS